MCRLYDPPNFKFLLFLLLFSCSCNKWLDGATAPKASPADSTLATDAAADQQLTDIQAGLMGEPTGGFGLLHGDVSRFCAGYAGELSWQGPPIEEEQFFRTTVDKRNRFLGTMWTTGYQCIVQCNVLLAMLERSPQVSPAMRSTLQGEARLLRALCYYYLVSLFDRIPLVMGTVTHENAALGQSPPDSVYDQVVNDLEAAVLLLPAIHPAANTDSVLHTRGTRLAAHALLARVYLYRENYVQAVRNASVVISSGLYQLCPSLDVAFQRTSPEVIFQLKPVNGQYLTAEGRLFQQEFQQKAIYRLAEPVLDAFGPGDLRALHWTRPKNPGNSPHAYPYKYRISGAQPRIEYNVLFRLSEIYLIRAEARARLGAIDGALADLNVVRARAGLLPARASTKDEVLLLTARERRAELFCELGHYWLDLKRWTRLGAGDVLQQYASQALGQRPGWQREKLHFPLPLSELDKNGKLVQNPGY